MPATAMQGAGGIARHTALQLDCQAPQLVLRPAALSYMGFSHTQFVVMVHCSNSKVEVLGVGCMTLPMAEHCRW